MFNAHKDNRRDLDCSPPALFQGKRGDSIEDAQNTAVLGADSSVFFDTLLDARFRQAKSQVTTASTSSGGSSLSAFLISCSGIRFTILLLTYRFCQAIAIENRKQFLNRLVPRPLAPDFLQPTTSWLNLPRLEVFDRKAGIAAGESASATSTEVFIS
jgi:hypothetical protein